MVRSESSAGDRLEEEFGSASAGLGELVAAIEPIVQTG